MKNNEAARKLTSKGTEAVTQFGLSIGNAVHIMKILRDTLYTDRVLAVLREYSSNAWDAHREAGIPDTPIKVALPTDLSPTLVIRDFGLGLSDNDVLRVYTQYGESTKRDTDDQVGALGIGCKSAFAYTDQFTVTSWYQGTKGVYVAVLDESSRGEMRRLHQEPCDETETGIEIHVPVRPHDVYTFERKAEFLFSCFQPKPNINLSIPNTPKLLDGKGYIDLDNRTWTAVMGCVPYRIDINQIADRPARFQNVGGALYFNIGDVEINASREELKYTEKTVAAITAAMDQLRDLYLENVVHNIREMTPWKQRTNIRRITTLLNLPFPDELEHLRGSSTISTAGFGTPENFLWASKELQIHPDTKLVIHNTDKPLAGYNILTRHAVIKPKKNRTIAELEAELPGYLEKASLTGIPKKYTSELQWYSWRRGRQTDFKDPKHRVKVFALNQDNAYADPKSARWNIVNREPQDDDVYVVLDRFEVPGMSREMFYDMFRQDKRLAKVLGIEDKMPEIYGYKTAVQSKAKGTEYREWRKTFFVRNFPKEKLTALQNRVMLEAFGWGGIQHISKNLKVLPEMLRKGLGKKHLITKTVLDMMSAVEDRSVQELRGLHHARELLQVAVRSKGKRRKKILEERYPMLAHRGLISYLQDMCSYYNVREAELLMWIDYIKLVDRDRKAQHSGGAK